MADVSKKEIIEKMEMLNDGSELKLRLSPTFGGGAAIIALNPAHQEKGQKKYLLWWGDDEAKAKAKSAFMSADKAKSIASWVADRAPHWAA